MERPTQGPHTETDRDLTERLSTETSPTEMTCRDTSQQKDTQRPQKHCPTETTKTSQTPPQSNTHRPQRHHPTETSHNMTGRHSPQRPHRAISQQTPLSDTFHRDLILKPHTNVTETSQRSLQHSPHPETIHRDHMRPQRYFTERPHRETDSHCPTETWHGPHIHVPGS